MSKCVSSGGAQEFDAPLVVGHTVDPAWVVPSGSVSPNSNGLGLPFVTLSIPTPEGASGIRHAFHVRMSVTVAFTHIADPPSSNPSLLPATPQTWQTYPTVVERMFPVVNTTGEMSAVSSLVYDMVLTEMSPAGTEHEYVLNWHWDPIAFTGPREYSRLTIATFAWDLGRVV